MGCGVSKLEPREGTTVVEAQPTNDRNVDAISPPSSEISNSSGGIVGRKQNASGSPSRLRGLRKIKADVHAIRRHHHHHHHHHNHHGADVDGRSNNTVSKNLLRPRPAAEKDGRLVVVVKAGGEATTTMAKDGNKEEHLVVGENSILVSVGSPSFRVYCVNDLSPFDDHCDARSHDDEYNEDDSEKEIKVPIKNDESNKGEEGNRKKKKLGGKMRGRGIRSVLHRGSGGGGGGGGGMRYMLSPRRLRNHSSDQLH